MTKNFNVFGEIIRTLQTTINVGISLPLPFLGDMIHYSGSQLDILGMEWDFSNSRIGENGRPFPTKCASLESF